MTMVFILGIATVLMTHQSCVPRRNHDAKILSANRFDQLFDQSDVLNMTLSAPLKLMFDTKNEKQSCDLDLETLDFDPPWFGDRVTMGQTGDQMIAAKIKVRGGVRFNCAFPPLKITFKKTRPGERCLRASHPLSLALTASRRQKGRVCRRFPRESTPCMRCTNFLMSFISVQDS